MEEQTKIEKVEIYGFRAAIRSLRQSTFMPQSDSFFGAEGLSHFGDKSFPWSNRFSVPETPFLGKQDMKLIQTAKVDKRVQKSFFGMLQIWADMTFPLYIWAEMGSYPSFSFVGLKDLKKRDFDGKDIDLKTLTYLNALGDDVRLFQNSKKIQNEIQEILTELKRKTPNGQLVKQTVQTNYSRIMEWSSYTSESTNVIKQWITELPYMNLFLAS